MTDKQAIYYELLVLRCQKGHKEAFEELIRSWEQRLFYYIRRLIDNEQDAWQILQETWLRVFESISKLRTAQSLPSWLYRIARNTAISHLRSESRKEMAKYYNDSLIVAENSTVNFSFDDAEQVHYGLGRLSLPHLSIEHISEVLSVPQGTVRSRLYHAKRMLKAILEKQE
ncbi:MAG: RNA polymerase sigma factor [Planctomycetota bacterium]|jgi:RNA polymerase sigma-70 factor (ECF subfamily)